MEKNGSTTESGEGPIPNYTDYYDILGVSPTATDREIKNRFMRLARSHHPDRNKVIHIFIAMCPTRNNSCCRER